MICVLSHLITPYKLPACLCTVLELQQRPVSEAMYLHLLISCNLAHGQELCNIVTLVTLELNDLAILRVLDNTAVTRELL